MRRTETADLEQGALYKRELDDGTLFEALCTSTKVVNPDTPNQRKVGTLATWEKDALEVEEGYESFHGWTCVYSPTQLLQRIADLEERLGLLEEKLAAKPARKRAAAAK